MSGMKNISLRFVDFGTCFTPADEPRRADKAIHKAIICANEVAMDVGGRCLGHDGENSLIIDHHFTRENNFPSAAAGVLHQAEKIHARLKDFEEVFLVTHTNPDFDALCSVYLADQLLQGEIPYEQWGKAGLAADSWTEVDKLLVDWFDPRLPIEENRRWPIMLAAYASCVDNCRRFPAPRTGSLHSVLYTAMARKRNMKDLAEIRNFFGEVRARITDEKLNPLYDEVFTDPGPYAPELRLLKHEEKAYRRDIVRARKCIVFLQKSKEFDSWYTQGVVNEPLLDDLGASRAGHSAVNSLEPADGIFLRDPECLLFKEWAREDMDNSHFRQGFLFTAIAYSNGRNGKINKTDYFFSLDPERADGAHLYNVWARLQADEVRELQKDVNADVACWLEQNKQGGRKEFVKRAGKIPPHLFGDPWFDGNTYRCTIVATPNIGTLIPEGTAADLTDDPVAELVRLEVEHCVFSGMARCADYSTVNPGLLADKAVAATAGVETPISVESYRFVEVDVDEKCPLDNPLVAEQIGRQVWSFLEPPGIRTQPVDFLERHFLRMPGTVIVWNRRGMVVASKESAEGTSRKVCTVDGERGINSPFTMARSGLEKAATMAGKLRNLSQELNNADNWEEHLKKGRDLMRLLVQLELDAAMPEGLALRRFLGATHFHGILESIDALNEKLQAEQEEKAQKEQGKRDRDLQLILAGGTAAGLLLAWNQLETLSIGNLFAPWWNRWIGKADSLLGLQGLAPNGSNHLPTSEWLRLSVGVGGVVCFLLIFLWRIYRWRERSEVPGLEDIPKKRE